MYSRYGGTFEREDEFVPAAEPPAPRADAREEIHGEPHRSPRRSGNLLGSLLGGENKLFRGKGPGGLFGNFSLKDLDLGDILLILIILLLLLDSEEDNDWVILIGLVLILGF